MVFTVTRRFLKILTFKLCPEDTGSDLDTGLCDWWWESGVVGGDYADTCSLSPAAPCQPWSFEGMCLSAPALLFTLSFSQQSSIQTPFRDNTARKGQILITWTNYACQMNFNRIWKYSNSFPDLKYLWQLSLECSGGVTLAVHTLTGHHPPQVTQCSLSTK